MRLPSWARHVLAQAVAQLRQQRIMRGGAHIVHIHQVGHALAACGTHR
jgi:hypothetical protein